MRLAILSCIFLFCVCSDTTGQTFALYRTGTLYDSFENPSQTAFVTDSSRRYAFNFFIPTLSATYGVSGPGVPTVKKALYTGKYDVRDLSETEKKLSRVTLSENTYLLAFKAFYSVRYHRELGFSWQVRTDGYGITSNPALIIFQDYNRVINDELNNTDFNNNLFNTHIYAQSYHQFSMTYREQYNKTFAYGLKMSYLSGIAYSKLKVNSSNIQFDPGLDDYSLYLDGDLRTNVYYDDMGRKMLIPGIKNPGLSLSLSTDHKLKQGWNIMANVKDLGFIRWSKNSYIFRDKDYKIKASAVDDSLWKDIKKQLKNKSYITPVNSKAEILVNKDLGDFDSNLILSKNLFYKGGDIAWVNSYQYKSLHFSATADYNLNRFFQAGAQVMIKSPNVEFFIGSDQMFKTAETKTALVNSDGTGGKGNMGASVYLGFSMKFGRLMSRWQNDTYIPGINIKTSENTGFFKKLFGKRSEY